MFFAKILAGLKEKKKNVSISEMAEIQDKVIENLGETLYPKALEAGKKALEKQRSIQNGFNDRLLKRWQKPIDLLEMELIASFEIGSEYNATNRSAAANNNDYLFDVLTRQHARSCLIGNEIVALLKNGFADGAFGRWRSLHETVAASFFIQKHGQQVAERFLSYEIIESYKQALAYQKHCAKLGEQPLDQRELDDLTAERDSAIKKYGENFASEYGWVPETIIKKPNFASIEALSGLDHLRPYYKMACFNVHSGPKSIKFNLALMKNSKPLLLAGPSNFGLADPGQAAAIAIYQMTACLITQKPTIDNLISLRFMAKLVEEIKNDFVEVQMEIEKEERVDS